jgi:hypothetical protein
VGEKEDMKDKQEETTEESSEASADSQAQSDEELETTEESSEASSDEEESAAESETEADPPQGDGDDESASAEADADGASGDGGDDGDDGDDGGDGGDDGDDGDDGGDGGDDDDGDASGDGDDDGDDEEPEEPSSEEEPSESEEAAAAGAEKVEAAADEAASSEEELDPDEPTEDEQPSIDEPEVEVRTPKEATEVQGVAAFFEHPKHLMAAATYARDSHYEEFEAYSPFPIHGMDEAMGLGRSWIPWVTFGAGSVGFVLANLLQFGTMTFDWPMIVGGKPFAPWPSFVPIMFELTVLLAGVTTAVVMLAAAGCFKKPTIIDPRITDDRFVLWISAEDTKFDEDEVTEFMSDLNPLEVRKIVKDA